MDKKTLRTKYLSLRNLVKKRSEKEKKINNLLKSLSFSSKDKVSGYFPVRGKLTFFHSLNF